jgi:hypothetical protein
MQRVLETSSMEFFCKDFERWNFPSNGASLQKNIVHNDVWFALNKQDLFKWLLLNGLQLHGWLFVNFHCSILLAKSLFEISTLTIWMISCKYLSFYLNMFFSRGEAEQVDDIIIHSFTICFSMVFLNTQKMNIMISVFDLCRIRKLSHMITYALLFVVIL